MDADDWDIEPGGEGVVAVKGVVQWLDEGGGVPGGDWKGDVNGEWAKRLLLEGTEETKTKGA